MKKSLYWIIVFVAGFAIYGSTELVLNEWAVGNICPKILGIPACYIVLFCFIGGLLAPIVPSTNGNIFISY